jgi:hypothetical protein
MAARASRIAFAIMLAALCAACGTASDPASFAVVVHDKYDTMPCFEINNQRKSLAGRVKELSELAAKAEAAPGGFIVSYSAYRSELAQVRGQLAAAERGAQKNECGPPK